MKASTVIDERKHLTGEA